MSSSTEQDGVVTDVTAIYKSIYKWEIPNFCITCPKTKSYLVSPILVHHESNMKFELRVYPQGYKEENNDYISICLRILENKIADVSLAIAILDSIGKKYYETAARKKYDMENNSWNDVHFVRQTNIMNNRAKFLSDKKLKFACEITVHKVFTDEDNYTRVSKRSRLDIGVSPSHAYNFEQFLGSEKFSDVSFATADDTKIHAHKCILVSKSEAFLTVFEKEMCDNIIDVKGIDFETLGEMLRFIYINKVENLSKVARQLLFCAEKYGLTDLKLLCETQICSDICSSNALDLVSYAESHNLTKLRKMAINYIVANMKEVVNAPNFKSMAIQYPEICVDILRLTANQH